MLQNGKITSSVSFDKLISYDLSCIIVSLRKFLDIMSCKLIKTAWVIILDLMNEISIDLNH